MDLNAAQPEGLPESSRWSESAETTGKVFSHDRTPKGCQTSGQRRRSFQRKDLAPLRGATQLISHSRWSSRTPTTGYFLCNPSGCAEVTQLYCFSPKGRGANFQPDLDQSFLQFVANCQKGFLLKGKQQTKVCRTKTPRTPEPVFRPNDRTATVCLTWDRLQN